MAEKALDDLEAVRIIVEALKNFKPEEQQRIIRWSIEKIGLSPTLLGLHGGGSSGPFHSSTPPPSPGLGQAPVSSGAVDIKSFIDEKQPRSDVQFAATVAYYLRFEAPAAERKECIGGDDLQEACRKVKRDRLKNPYQTLLNAHNLGLLDKGPEKASFAINTVGENLVAMTLPGDGKLPAKSRRNKKTDTAKRSLRNKAAARK